MRVDCVDFILLAQSASTTTIGILHALNKELITMDPTLVVILLMCLVIAIAIGLLNA
jgi:hypothetical protein